MIHGTFKDIPSEDMAKAVSETLTTDAFKFATPKEVDDRYGPNGWPPVPAYNTSVLATYIEGKGARMQYVNLMPDMVTNLEVGEAYTTYVGGLQDKIPIIEALLVAVPELGSSIEGMKRWCVERTAREGRGLVAAHLTARVPADGQLIQAVVYPKAIMAELPMIFRSATVAIVPQLEEIVRSGIIPGVDEKDFKQALGPLLRAEDIIANIALYAITSLLPDAKRFTSSIANQP